MSVRTQPGLQQLTSTSSLWIAEASIWVRAFRLSFDRR